jgi:3-(3-hydroxy-phenyl)propionate hydroxylase
VLTGRAGVDLLATYQTERRPHVKALIRKAVLAGWVMTGGQDRAAAIRKLALGGIMRSARVQELVGSTATPRLRAGAIRRTPSRVPRSLRAGGLIPNPLLRLADGRSVRLDEVLRGQTAVLTARCPEPRLLDACRAQDITPVRVTEDRCADPDPPADTGWLTVHLAGRTSGLWALIDDPTLTVVVRPDRVIACVATRSRLPHLPWTVPPPTRPGTAGT